MDSKALVRLEGVLLVVGDKLGSNIYQRESGKDVVGSAQRAWLLDCRDLSGYTE